ncbi:MAG: hypothetical protein ACHWZW_03210 [Spirulina sp.]
MKLLLFLLTTSALVLWVGLAPAQAEDFALNFDPPALPQPSPPPEPPEPPEPTPFLPPEQRPLPIPSHGTRPPMRFHSPSQLPSGVNRQAVAVALNEGHSAMDVLPPVPPRMEPDPAVVEAPAPDATPPDPVAAIPPEPAPKPDDVILSFGVDSTDASATVAQAEPEPPPATPPPAPVLSTLFEGGNQSLVARTVGSAEGTRTATGGFTSAYHGHTDPGNRAWNMGTFSYQHGATSAAEADRKQLKRLQSQTGVLERRALNRGMNLTLEETLNGIDLANQSPLASIGRVGYIERLSEVRTWGLEGTEAIVVARTRSYINPNTGRWNAPGLGNTEASITRDQRRRTDAIARALEAYRLEYPHLNLAPTLVTIAPPEVLAAAQPPVLLPTPEPEPDTVPVKMADFSEPPSSEAPLAETPASENSLSENSLAETPASENSPPENPSSVGASLVNASDEPARTPDQHADTLNLPSAEPVNPPELASQQDDQQADDFAVTSPEATESVATVTFPEATESVATDPLPPTPPAPDSANAEANPSNVADSPIDPAAETMEVTTPATASSDDQDMAPSAPSPATP